LAGKRLLSGIIGSLAGLNFLQENILMGFLRDFIGLWTRKNSLKSSGPDGGKFRLLRDSQGKTKPPKARLGGVRPEGRRLSESDGIICCAPKPP